jgi:hypothetical protein
MGLMGVLVFGMFWCFKRKKERGLPLYKYLWGQKVSKDTKPEDLSPAAAALALNNMNPFLPMGTGSGQLNNLTSGQRIRMNNAMY